MNAAQFGYAVEEAFAMLLRRKAANIISIVIMGFSLFILLVFLLVTLNVQTVIDRASDEMRLYVYLEDGTSESARNDLSKRLLQLEGVEEVVFVSREEALRSFRETLGEDKDIVNALEGNPLPDAFKVKVKPQYLRSSRLEAMARTIETWDAVEEARYGEQWLEKGEALVKGFYVADLFVGAIILLSVGFVIANTVRLAVISRQKTIEITKLVGATSAYIRIPFVFEGAFQGAIAALLALALAAVTYTFAKGYMSGLLFVNAQAAAIFVGFCALLGGIGSIVSMRRLVRF